MSLLGFLIEYKWVLLFYVLVAAVVYLNRKKFDQEAKFIYLYRTKHGLAIINRLAKYKRFIKALCWPSLIVGFLGVVWITWELLKRTYEVLISSTAIGVAPVLPGLPIAGTGIKFPLLIGWISLFVIIVIHEFSHGVVARVFKIPVKSTGIAFFGPILAAFVEPDENKLKKAPPFAQNAEFAAGPFFNIVTSLVFLAILGFVLAPIASSMTKESGLIISPTNSTTPAKLAGLPDNTWVVAINGEHITSIAQFINFSLKLKQGQAVTLTSNEGKDYDFTSIQNPNNATRGFMGITVIEVVEKPKYSTILSTIGFHVFRWLSELFFWLYFISLNLGLVNLFPIFITDGARLVQTVTTWLIKDEKKSFAVWKLINQACVLLLLLLLIVPLIRMLF